MYTQINKEKLLSEIYESLDSAIEEYESENIDLAVKIEDLGAELHNKTIRVENLERALKNADRKYEKSTEKSFQYKAEIEEKIEIIDKLDDEIDDLKSKNAEYLELINERNIKISDLNKEIRSLQEYGSLIAIDYPMIKYKQLEIIKHYGADNQLRMLTEDTRSIERWTELI